MCPLRVREMFNDSRLTLLALESVDIQRSKTNAGCWLYGSIEPMAVIVCGPDGILALDMEAKLVALDRLMQEIPELETIIAPTIVKETPAK